MQLVSYYGSTHLEEDKSALRESQKKKMPSLPILQARLLFDGGYLDKALDEIHRQDVNTLATDEDKQEYYYRQGRIYDAMNSYDKALDSYNTSTRYNIPGMYYAPASCLYSGMIWERRGNSNNARAFYKKCLSYTSYLYKDSFDQKAYAGLKRLE
jgi:tetratricopeptide (TPR) repeat protein